MEDFLCVGHYFIEGAEDLLAYLAPKYRLYLASNGTARVQESRLKSAGIGPYFSKCSSPRSWGQQAQPGLFPPVLCPDSGFDPQKPS